ncbi:hypothetical protein CNMCM8927_008781 [Aspergillus lentulus]|uniref:Zn(2)-C6 fungal-type domain-containing protein n=1 Tax=Aspergillus lentulus TaxID=293939 RepID=A0AAN6BSC4_ASPLE|nr:hypothetical protein CNMCM6069_009329 [Aspergillus lentulus]KAF4181863.1 hypothetical protein CNMCM8060_008234 [Aspergillus lentulus]KAF4189813.1 hypothetical protein CNMCM7927_006597 [Aspergillus lentulus]KAF4198093.1 hypothetical protein CNMCM8694_000777 [Aspergillus lentulus]KAF4208832.1 hypothetical protein CNMCM8927_008781 [Aspergillus lentulus]
MNDRINRPVKAACLACRTSKTRCDGQNPCRPAAAIIDAPQSTPSLTDESTLTPVDSNLWGSATPFSSLGRNHDSGRALKGVWSPPHTESQGDLQGPVLRVYTSEEEIQNAYYHFVHPCLPLLPPPRTSSLPQENPHIFQPSHGLAGTVELSCLPYQPTSSLSLALSAILVLIPPPHDRNQSEPCSVWLRRSYAQLFAQAALRTAEKEIEDFAGGWPSPAGLVEGRTFHPQLPTQLHPILALIVLSVYDLCQCGNKSRMRMRANQAITTAMDYSLHQLDENAIEAQRRAWWTAVIVMYHSSAINDSPWSLLLKAQDAIVSVCDVMRPVTAKNQNGSPALDLREQACRLDRHILSLAADCDLESEAAETDRAENLAALSLWKTACAMTHTARVKLHRYRAFSDIPIFLEKHCDLDFLKLDGFPSQTASLPAQSDLDSIFPFTQNESSVICLKSSLAISRALAGLPLSVYLPLRTEPRISSDTTGYTGSLPFFKCAAMQASYVLYMLVHRVRAALSSKRLSVCYPLLNHPEPVTEVQDANRLIEELRNGAHSMIVCMKRDLIFEGISGMIRDLDAAYSSLFPN